MVIICSFKIFFLGSQVSGPTFNLIKPCLKETKKKKRILFVTLLVVHFITRKRVFIYPHEIFKNKKVLESNITRKNMPSILCKLNLHRTFSEHKLFISFKIFTRLNIDLAHTSLKIVFFFFCFAPRKHFTMFWLL